MYEALEKEEASFWNFTYNDGKPTWAYNQAQGNLLELIVLSECYP